MPCKISMISFMSSYKDFPYFIMILFVFLIFLLTIIWKNNILGCLDEVMLVFAGVRWYLLVLCLFCFLGVLRGKKGGQHGQYRQSEMV